MIKTTFEPDCNFGLPFESVILRKDGSFEYLITKRLSLSFFNLVMTSDNQSVDTNLLEIIVKLDTIETNKKLLMLRIGNLEEFEDERINKHFSGNRRPIFFDAEESSRMNDLFLRMRFLAEAEIMYDGEPKEFKKLSSTDQETIVRVMDELGLVCELSPAEFKNFKNVRQVKMLVKRSKYKGGIKIMNKKDLVKKAILGSLAIATGGIIATAGGISMHKALSVLLGVSNEVILVENDTSEEAKA